MPLGVNLTNVLNNKRVHKKAQPPARVMQLYARVCGSMARGALWLCISIFQK